MPRAASATASTTSSPSGVPVGLLGAEAHDVGVVLAHGGDGHVADRSSKSASRGRGDPLGAGARGEQRVHRVRGREADAVRPGPPKACRMCWSTSFEPFAAQIRSGVEAVAQVVGEALAQVGELTVGVAVQAEDRGGDAGDDVVGDVLGDRMRVLVDVQGDGDDLLRGAVRGLRPRRSSRMGRSSRLVTDRDGIDAALVDRRRPDVTERPEARAAAGLHDRIVEPVEPDDLVDDLARVASGAMDSAMAQSESPHRQVTYSKDVADAVGRRSARRRSRGPRRAPSDERQRGERGERRAHVASAAGACDRRWTGAFGRSRDRADGVVVDPSAALISHLRVRFASDPRPGGPDAKLCSEYIFERSKLQAPVQNSRVDCATHSNECLPCACERIQFRMSEDSRSDTTDIRSSRRPANEGRRPLSTDIDGRARDRQGASAQEPEREAARDPRGHPALGREPRLPAEHARDRRRGRPLVAVERDPPAEPARARGLPPARPEPAARPRGAHRPAGHRRPGTSAGEPPRWAMPPWSRSSAASPRAYRSRPSSRSTRSSRSPASSWARASSSSSRSWATR